jgi:hypothetical protein
MYTGTLVMATLYNGHLHTTENELKHGFFLLLKIPLLLKPPSNRKHSDYRLSDYMQKKNINLFSIKHTRSIYKSTSYKLHLYYSNDPFSVHITFDYCLSDNFN